MLLRVNFTLRAGKAYVLNEISMVFGTNAAGDWENMAQLFVGNSSPIMDGVDVRIPIPFVDFGNNGLTVGLKALQVSSGTLPRTPIIPPVSQQFNLSAQNLTATATTAGTVDFHVSFFEFDLDQISFYAANSAMAVITR